MIAIEIVTPKITFRLVDSFGDRFESTGAIKEFFSRKDG